MLKKKTNDEEKCILSLIRNTPKQKQVGKKIRKFSNRIDPRVCPVDDTMNILLIVSQCLEEKETSQ